MCLVTTLTYHQMMVCTQAAVSSAGSFLMYDQKLRKRSKCDGERRLAARQLSSKRALEKNIHLALLWFSCGRKVYNSLTQVQRSTLSDDVQQWLDNPWSNQHIRPTAEAPPAKVLELAKVGLLGEGSDAQGAREGGHV
eukprot:TRINITY_DN18092_c0_g1_i1.p1 TRINITY_DN18092_c0_g1~~TRINITY_DN18092_c0_g1_i1.p1  ORF type:complete len:138 (-),score=7.72 TRINITY_DN18092_c0_g1_i1:74-487(-)